jgi:hypothetical protein
MIDWQIYWAKNGGGCGIETQLGFNLFYAACTKVVVSIVVYCLLSYSFVCYTEFLEDWSLATYEFSSADSLGRKEMNNSV